MTLQKKTRVIISLSIAILSWSSIGFSNQSKSVNHSESNIKQPCLKDRLYTGIALGYDAFNATDEIFFSNLNNTSSIKFNSDLRAQDWTAGAFVGYGRYIEQFYQAYFGVEIFVNGSSADTDYLLVLNNSETFSTDIDIKSTFGVSFLPGFKINPSTLIYARIGYNWATVNLNEVSFDVDDFEFIPVDFDKNVTTHGISYGAGIESAFFKDFSVRAEYTHTKYNQFKIDSGTRITPTNNQFMFGLICHIV